MGSGEPAKVLPVIIKGDNANLGWSSHTRVEREGQNVSLRRIKSEDLVAGGWRADLHCGLILVHGPASSDFHHHPALSHEHFCTTQHSLFSVIPHLLFFISSSKPQNVFAHKILKTRACCMNDLITKGFFHLFLYLPSHKLCFYITLKLTFKSLWKSKLRFCGFKYKCVHLKETHNAVCLKTMTQFSFWRYKHVEIWWHHSTFFCQIRQKCLIIEHLKCPAP